MSSAFVRLCLTYGFATSNLGSSLTKSYCAFLVLSFDPLDPLVKPVDIRISLGRMGSRNSNYPEGHQWGRC